MRRFAGCALALVLWAAPRSALATCIPDASCLCFGVPVVVIEGDVIDDDGEKLTIKVTRVRTLPNADPVDVEVGDIVYASGSGHWGFAPQVPSGTRRVIVAYTSDPAHAVSDDPSVVPIGVVAAIDADENVTCRWQTEVRLPLEDAGAAMLQTFWTCQARLRGYGLVEPPCNDTPSGLRDIDVGRGCALAPGGADGSPVAPLLLLCALALPVWLARRRSARGRG